MSALQLLRGAIQNGTKVSLDGDELVIGTSRVPRMTQTPYRSDQGRSALYTIDTIWFWLECESKSLQYGKYIIASKKKKIKTVKRVDIKELSAYMRGKKDTSKYLDTSAHLAVPTTSRTAAVKRPLDLSEWKTNHIIDRERHALTRASIMQARKKFSSFVASFNETPPVPTITLPARRPESKRGHHLKRRKTDSVDGHIPIILVPGAVSSPITIYNAKQLLGQGGYIASETLRSQSTKREKVIKLERASHRDNRKIIVYHIMDDVSQLSKADWSRVVAVFATGKKWQFKNFPNREPAKIFDQMRGFHLHFSEEKMHPNISQWKVKPLPISKTLRHKDRAAILEFWRCLETWMASNPTKMHLDF